MIDTKSKHGEIREKKRYKTKSVIFLIIFRIDPPNAANIIEASNETDFSRYAWRLLHPDVNKHIQKDSVIIPYEICEDCIVEGI